MVAMTTAPVAPGVAAIAEAARRSARVVGVDIARCLALFGMMVTHIVANIDPVTGSFVPWHQQVAGGRAAALFAVLAGVSLALVTGREHQFRGRQLTAARVGIALRAGVIGTIGLLLSGLDSGVAVILTYYGLLFLLAIPFLGLGWRTLGVLAIVWAVAAPVLSQLIRPHLPAPTYGPASMERLFLEPHILLSELTFTGYYPTVSWLAYVLAGLAVGRLALSRVRVAASLALGGGALALATWALSYVLTRQASVFALLEDELPHSTPEFRCCMSPPGSLDLVLAHGFWGTTPTTTWWWLTIVAPHSTTPFDLLHTIGASLLVLGLALMLGRLAPRVLGVVFAAGTMTLTLYTLHVLALANDFGPERGPSLYWFHVCSALVLAALWRTGVGQGPLEWVTASVAKLGSAAVLALPRSRARAGTRARTPTGQARLRGDTTMTAGGGSGSADVSPQVSGEPEVHDNPADHRFEIWADGELAGFSRYEAIGDARAFVHTEIEERYAGRGYGSVLARAALTAMLEARTSVLPFCPFVRRFIQRHEEFLHARPRRLNAARFGLPRVEESAAP